MNDLLVKMLSPLSIIRGKSTPSLISTRYCRPLSSVKTPEVGRSPVYFPLNCRPSVRTVRPGAAAALSLLQCKSNRASAQTRIFSSPSKLGDENVLPTQPPPPIFYTHTHTHTHKPHAHARTHARAHARAHACIHTCLSTCQCTDQQSLTLILLPLLTCNDRHCGFIDVELQ